MHRPAPGRTPRSLARPRQCTTCNQSETGGMKNGEGSAFSMPINQRVSAESGQPGERYGNQQRKQTKGQHEYHVHANQLERGCADAFITPIWRICCPIKAVVVLMIRNTLNSTDITPRALINICTVLMIGWAGCWPGLLILILRTRCPVRSILFATFSAMVRM